jgi:queuine tRNA-ribosyltransferase
MFQLIKQSKSSKARLGRIKTVHGIIETPVFMPIATRAAVKNLTPEELEELGAQIILSNTYHLLIRPGIEIIEKAGGLHQFMHWPKPILTDSGGYQVFSLAKFRKINDSGVKFQSEIDGREIFLTPEKVIEIQQKLGSDIMMVLDECLGWPCSEEEATQAVKRTTFWAKRSKEEFKRLNQKFLELRPLLFGIVQGGVYPNLRKQSVQEITALDFDGYAIGGLTVGEPIEKTYEMIKLVTEYLPEDKPRYLMGAGKPEQIVEAVKMGIDMFDCVIPTRNARHGLLYITQINADQDADKRRYLTQINADQDADKRRYLSAEIWTNVGIGQDLSKSEFSNLRKSARLSEARPWYEEIHITNEKFKNDFGPIDKNCHCYTCQNYSRAYLRHLFMTEEPLAQKLATIHNLAFYLNLMKEIRESIDS